MSKEQKAGNMKLKIYFMIKIYFKTAGRNLIKNKVSSFINISGLAIGMAVAILIGLWIWDELSFDTCNKNYNAIAQVARKEILNGDAYVSNNNNHFPIPLAGELRMNYNNLFKHVSLTTEKGKHIIDFNGNKFSEQGMYVEKDFTNMFTLNMTAGTSADFSDPNSILLSKSVAQALFSRQLGNSSVYIFTQAAPSISMEKISGAIKDIYWKKIKDKQVQTAGNRVDIFLHPMKDWHLRSEWKNGVQAGG